MAKRSVPGPSPALEHKRRTSNEGPRCGSRVISTRCERLGYASRHKRVSPRANSGQPQLNPFEEPQIGLLASASRRSRSPRQLTCLKPRSGISSARFACIGQKSLSAFLETARGVGTAILPPLLSSCPCHRLRSILDSRLSGYLKLGFGGEHTESNQRLIYTWA
jgi:hypothetical protein